ncbi:MAG: hypothetical protein ACYC6Y_10450 [Thermoguttaceae bacterium]
MRIDDEKIRDWFLKVLRARARETQAISQERTEELQRQLTLARHQQGQLLNLRLMEEIEADTFAAKNTELRDKIARLTLQVESADRGRAEQTEMAVKRLNFRKAFRTNGLRQTMPLSGISLKSPV